MPLASLQPVPSAAVPSAVAKSAKSRVAELLAADWQTAAGQAEIGFDERARSSGLAALDAMLPSGGLPLGRVIELAVSGSAWGTRVGLSMCCVAQQQARKAGGSGWCAFIDPAGSLYAPGAVSLGVDLERLLVVRPPWEMVERIAVRMAEARLFSVLVIDAVGVLPDATASHSWPARWQRTVKRLALAIRGTGAQVVLLTDQAQVRPLPLPVGLRLEFAQLEAERLWVRVAKEQRGRIGSQQVIAWDGMPNADSRFSSSSGNSVALAHLAKCPSSGAAVQLPSSEASGRQG